MSRPLRLEYEGALYHVTSRGDRRGTVFATDADRAFFVTLLSRVVGRFGWRVHAWCEMTNHYHLLVETPRATLSNGMRMLNGHYANAFNRRNDRVGHVFQGRYTAILVEREPHLLELCRYVVLNPVRARMVETADRWAWSSYRSTAGLCEAPPWFQPDAVLSLFGSAQRSAQARYRRFVAAGDGAPSPWASLRNGWILGSDAFVKRHIEEAKASNRLEEVPREARRGQPRALAAFVEATSSRDAAIAAAYESGDYTLKEIGAHFGLHYSRVSRIVKTMRGNGPEEGAGGEPPEN